MNDNNLPQEPNRKPDPQGNTSSHTSQQKTQTSFSGKQQDTQKNNFQTQVVKNDTNNGAQDTILTPSSTKHTTPHVPKKYGGPKAIATIFGILLLIAGVTAGIFLVQQPQEIRERAAVTPNPNSNCDPRNIITSLISISDDSITVHFENPGECDHEAGITSYSAGSDEDGLCVWPNNMDCQVRFDFNDFTIGAGETVEQTISKPAACYQIDWYYGTSIEQLGNPEPCYSCQERLLGTETSIPPECADQPTQTPTPTEPPITGRCSEVVAYDTEWNVLSSDDLSALSPGDVIRFAVSGSASEGFFDMARFTINGVERDSTSNKVPGSDEFFDEYIVPDGVNSFSVSAQIHHSSLGWF